MNDETCSFDLIPEEHAALAVILSEGILRPVDFYFAAKSSPTFNDMMDYAIEVAFADHHSVEGRRRHAAIAKARDAAYAARRRRDEAAGLASAATGVTPLPHQPSWAVNAKTSGLDARGLNDLARKIKASGADLTLPERSFVSNAQSLHTFSARQEAWLVFLANRSGVEIGPKDDRDAIDLATDELYESMYRYGVGE